MMGAALVAVVLAASPLDTARDAYQAGELARARTELESLLYPMKLDGEALEAEARMLLAGTYHAQEELARAEEEVVRGLGARPDVTLDPLLYPPDFIAFVARVRASQAERISALQAERRPTRPTPVVPPPSVELPEAARPSAPSRAWYLAPFGIGHFKHGRSGAGTALAVTQGVSLAVSAVSLGAALGMRGPDGLYSAKDAGTARTLNATYLVGAWLFAAAYGYGVVDGTLLSPAPATPPAR